MRHLIALAIVAVLGLAAPATATDLSKEYRACMDSAQSNADFDACSGAELARQDTWLNAAWTATSTAMRLVSADGAASSPSQLLLNGQRAWLAYRDSACEFYRSGFGREGVVISYGACKAGIIAERVQWLKDVLAHLTPGK